MMPAAGRDLPALLVRAAAAQLGDDHLAARYEEEWLASLPARDGYFRWRYALSLVLRGARATRWAAARPSPARGMPAGATLRAAACLAAIASSVMLARDYVSSAESSYACAHTPWVDYLPGCVSLPSPLSVIVYGNGSGWPPGPAVSIISWCVMLCALMAVSLASRPGRLAAGCGVLLGGIQAWTGITFFQGNAPAALQVGPDDWRIFMEPWSSVASGIVLGAVMGGIISALRYRASWLVRAAVLLGVSSLLAETQYFQVLGVPDGSPIWVAEVALGDVRVNLPGVPHAVGLLSGGWFSWAAPISIVQVFIVGVSILGVARVIMIAIQLLRACPAGFPGHRCKAGA